MVDRIAWRGAYLPGNWAAPAFHFCPLPPASPCPALLSLVWIVCHPQWGFILAAVVLNSVPCKYADHVWAVNTLNYSCKGTDVKKTSTELTCTPPPCSTALPRAAAATWIVPGKPPSLGAAARPPWQGGGCLSVWWAWDPSAHFRVLQQDTLHQVFAPCGLGRGHGRPCMAGKPRLARAAVMRGTSVTSAWVYKCALRDGSRHLLLN